MSPFIQCLVYLLGECNSLHGLVNCVVVGYLFKRIKFMNSYFGLGLYYQGEFIAFLHVGAAILASVQLVKVG